MRRLILGTIGLFFLSIPGFAQEYVYPKAEVFGGLSVARPGTMWGWQSAVHGNFSHTIGFTADIGGQYKSILGVGTSSHQFLFGPRFIVRREKVTPFVHTLFGASRAKASIPALSIPGFPTIPGTSVSSTGLAMSFGGGLDVNLSDRFSIRVAQVDWIPTRFNGGWSTDAVRLGFGIVLKAAE